MEKINEPLNLTTLLRQFEELKNLISNNNTKPHLTKRETAEFFDVSLNCITDWTRKGLIKAYYVGQRVYYKRTELESVLFNSKDVA